MTNKREKESRAVARKPRDVLFSLKFADNIRYKFKSCQATKARLQIFKHTGTKQNLTQNGRSRSFKVTCFLHWFVHITSGKEEDKLRHRPHWETT